MTLKITDPPPDEIKAELLDLKADLDRKIPPKLLDRNLLIATWNIRSFGPVTKKWRSSPDRGPKRDLHSILSIAEIIKRFDVVALNELRSDAQGFQQLLQVLGENWGFMLSDIMEGSGGNLERLAFLFDVRKLTPSGLVGEYVISPEELERASQDSLKRQFYRTPYIASFRVASKVLTLVNVHIAYGGIGGDKTRQELAALVKWLRELAKENSDFTHTALKSRNLDRNDLSYCISDHLPLWVEFSLRE